MIDWTIITSFDWDEGNIRKSLEKYDASQFEAEQVFFNQPLLIVDDVKHSQKETRFHALGKTDSLRLLHITFTLRSNDSLIRVISTRDMHRKEKTVHGKVKKDS